MPIRVPWAERAVVADELAPRSAKPMFSGAGAQVRAGAIRLGEGVATLFIISVVTFAASNYRPPNDIARAALGQGATPDQLRAFVSQHHLNDPLVTRYFQWLGDLLRGNWGISPITNRPVMDDLLPRFEHTVILACVTVLLSTPLAIGVGVWMARTRRNATRLGISVGTVIFAALPEFVIGSAFLLVFGVMLRWLPVISTGVTGGTFGDAVLAYVMPLLTLVVAVVPYVARITSAAVADTLRSPYVQAGMLRGVSRRRLTFSYALRNASGPIVTAVGLNIVYLLTGVVVVENLFAFPGVGQDLVQAINVGDAVTVQAIAMLMGAFFIATGVVSDLIAIYLNPRLKATK